MNLPIINNVIVGTDRELFLSSDRHFTLDLMMGAMKIAPRNFRAFADNIERRQRLSAQYGVRYVHLVAPDKHVVMQDRFPLRKFFCLAERYAKLTRTDFLYPVDELRGLERSYGRTDTHWNLAGTIVIASLLASSLGFRNSEVSKGAAALRGAIVVSDEMVAGDLGVKLDPPELERKERFELPWRVHRFMNGVRSNDGRIVATVSESPYARGRLVVFGDSFIALAQRALTAFFREIIFCRTRFYHEEIVLSAKPDYVVSENAERYLSSVQRDTEAPPMLLMPQMMGRATQFQPGHARAIGALLSPGTRNYQEFIASLASQPQVGEIAS